MRGTIILLLFFITATNLSAQSSDTIYWDASRKLTWADFKGKPNYSTNLLAMTQAGIGYEVACNNGKLDLKITCYFNAPKSWSKQKEPGDLLRHEQVHFDITELFARKLRKRISELADPCGKDIDKLNTIYDANFKECSKMQDLYDKESNHSLDKLKQKEWEEKIAKELKEMEAFTG